jgi:hypothetical protein
MLIQKNKNRRNKKPEEYSKMDDVVVLIDNTCTNPNAKVPKSQLIPKNWGCNYSEANFQAPPRDSSSSNFVTPNGVVSQLMAHCLQSTRGSFSSLKVGHLDVCDIIVHGNAHNICQTIESVIDDTGTRTMRYHEDCDSVIGNESFLMGVQNFNTTGTQLSYHNLNGAFRVGDVSGNQWNIPLLGDNSVAFGSDTTALGQQSFSVGSDNLVNGQNNIVFGNNNLLFDNFSSTASPLVPSDRARNSIILNGQSNDIGSDGVIAGDSLAINSIIGGTNNQLAIINCSTALAHNTIGQAENCTIVGGEGTSGSPITVGIGIGSNTLTTSVTQSDITAPVTNSMLFFDGHPNSYPTLHELNILKQVFKRGFIRAGGSSQIGYGDDGARERMIPYEVLVPGGGGTASLEISITQNTIVTCNAALILAAYDTSVDPPIFRTSVQTVSQFIALRSSISGTPSSILHPPTVAQQYSSDNFFSDVTNTTVTDIDIDTGIISIVYTNNNAIDVKLHAVIYAYDMNLSNLITVP